MSEERDRDEREPVSLKHYYDIGMSLLYLGLAAYIYKMPNKDNYVLGNGLYFFAGMLALFGLFRLGRGVYVMMQKMKRK